MINITEGLLLFIKLLFAPLIIKRRRPASPCPFDDSILAHRGGVLTNSTRIYLTNRKNAELYSIFENSKEAIELAGLRKLNKVTRIRGVEVDIQLSKDNVPVLLHDPTLDRTTTGTGNVKDYNFKELQTFRLKSVDESIASNQTLIDLNEAITIAKKYDLLLDLDIKDTHNNKKLVQEIIKIIRSHNYESKTLLSSFYLDILVEIKLQDPSLWTAYATIKNSLIGSKLRDRIQYYLSENFIMKSLSIDFIEPKLEEINIKNIKAFKQLGFMLNVWTVNKLSDKERLESFRVSYITDID